jgi:hypothetical protein
MLVIENRRPGIVGFGGLVTLQPGENRVKEKDWQRVLDTDPTVRHYLDSDEVVVVDEISQEGDDGDPPRSAGTLLSSGAPTTVDAPGGEATRVPGDKDAARAQVEGTTDVAQLEAWASGEDRSSVKKAIERRLTELRG